METIDWNRLERIMLRSFRGEHLSDEDNDLCQQAFNADPEQYAQHHKAVKEEEIRRIRMF